MTCKLPYECWWMLKFNVMFFFRNVIYVIWNMHMSSLGLKEQLFCIACDPSVPSVDTRSVDYAACAGVTLYQHHDPCLFSSLHRRLRAKRSKLRHFLKHLCLQPALTAKQCLRGAQAVRFLSGHHSRPHYKVPAGIATLVGSGAAAYRCHGTRIGMPDPKGQRETMGARTSSPKKRPSFPSTTMPRSLHQVPRLLVPCRVPYRHRCYRCYRTWLPRTRTPQLRWKACYPIQRKKICVWNNAISTTPGNASRKWNARNRRWPSENYKCRPFSKR